MKVNRVRRALRWVAIVLAAVVCLLLCYVLYVELSYSRLGDGPLEVTAGGAKGAVQLGVPYTVTTYNIGFGAYQQDYTCVLDVGYAPDGKGGFVQVQGKNLKAFSKEAAQQNTQGSADAVAALDPDFAFFQEVDTKANRSYGIDQAAMLQNGLPGRDGVFACNFHTPYLFYPLNDPMGFANSGLLTLSRFSIQEAERHEFVVTTDWILRCFDLDRCFSASYVPVENGKQLVLVNVHMSAYDEGGVIRALQREQLYSFLENEYKKGNYLVVGGDTNHDLLTNNPDYPQYTGEDFAFAADTQQKQPDWLAFFFDENGSAGLPAHFMVVASDNAPTCRDADVTWQPGYTYVSTLDGFLVSDNVKVLAHQNIVTVSSSGLEGFAFSDHQPAWMQFSLLS